MRSFLSISLVVASLWAEAQIYWQQENYNPIITGVQYLQMAPDARSVGLGQSGAASSPDVFSMHWNPAKYSFAEDRFGISVSYTDYFWMKEVWDYNYLYEWSMGFITLNSYYHLKERSALAFSFTYFNPTGETTLTDEWGNEMGIFNPFDINMDVAYSYRFNDNLSAALAGRYIFSRMIKGEIIEGTETKNANAVAFDMAVYYQKALQLGSKDGEIRLGADISNIGTKISYVKNSDTKRFLPTNLGLGAGFTYNFNDDHSLSVQIDGNKLLVPTPPLYLRDTNTGAPVVDEDGNYIFADGMDPNVSVIKGMIQSWYDAPGGFQEEMHEWSFGGGLEYRYKTYFSARSGIFYEHKSKGGRRFYNAGLGFKVGIFGMDFALMLPLEGSMSDDYMSLFYFRSSVVFTLPE